MSSHHSASVRSDSQPKCHRPWRLLVVDRDPEVGRTLSDFVDRDRFQVHQAQTLAEARGHLAAVTVDLALIDLDLPDGCGMTLADELQQRRSSIQTIMISNDPSLQRAIRAMRVGADDFIVKPFAHEELNDRVHQAVQRRKFELERRRRVRRLKRICKKLNHLRSEVTQQVDILCQDLVTAYQELAQQMHHMMQATEFGTLMRSELDLEQLLRKTLEYLINKIGPTNAAIFLPASCDRFTLGGYINYDCASDSADMLLEHLADIVALRVAECEEPIHITDNSQLSDWFGDDSAYLVDCHVLAFRCRHEDETLGVVVLFRDPSCPYDNTAMDTAVTIGPMLGDYLARVIRIHHRHLDGGDADNWDVSA